ncbi:MAG: MMPL family transporter [Desulfatibacillaceae bacterium]
MDRQTPQRSRFAAVLEWITLHPWRVIALFAAATLFFGYHALDLRFKTSIYDLAIKDLPETRYYEQFKEEFGAEQILFVVAKTDDVLEAETFARISALAEEFGDIPGADRTMSLPGIKEDMELLGEWSVAEFAKKIEPVELFRQNFISGDRTATVISILLENNADEEAAIAAVDRIMERENARGGLHLYQIGMPNVAAALAEYTEQDFMTLPPITYVVILLVLFVLFGTARGILVPGGTVAVAVVWNFGIMSLLGVPLSLMTMIVPVFLIAVGTAYLMHIMTEYRAQAAKSETPAEAVSRCFARMGFPTTLAVGTTAIGLGSLLINRITGTREFAAFSMLGMLIMLVLMLFCLPAVTVLLPLPKREFRETWLTRVVFRRALEKVVALDLRHQKVTLPVAAALVLLSVVGVFFIRVETNPVGYFKESTPIAQRFHDIYEDLAGSFPVNLVLDAKSDGYFENPENLRKIEDIQKYAETLDGVDKTVGFNDFLKLVNYADSMYDPGAYQLPERDYRVRMLTNSYKAMLGDDMYKRFMSPGMGKTHVLLRTHLKSTADFVRVGEQLEEYLEINYPGDFVGHVTGLGMVVAESSTILTNSQIKSLSLTLVLIFGMMIVLFLSGRVGVVAIIINLFPIIVCFGAMGWLSIELSAVTSLIASIAIGLAVDDTIHYLFRYNREFRRDLDKDRALRETIRHVGMPIMFTTLTISVGFSVLLFSHFEPTAVFGGLMVLTMFAALVGDLILLPSLMLHVELVTAWDVLRLIPSLGGLSAGIAHELNQPLTAIKMGNDYLAMMLEQDREIPEDDLRLVVAQTDEQVQRASRFVNRLAEFGRKPEVARERVSVNRAVRDTLSIVEHQFELENVVVRTDLDEDLCPVLAHANRLGQVVYNLLQNSAEAIADRRSEEPGAEGVITVETRMRDDRVWLEVHDTGTGVPGEIAERIMEPFFTTRGEGQGRGLGLPISRQIVSDYKGRLHFRRDARGGAIFVVSLPCAPV